MKTVYSPFVRRYRNQATRMARTPRFRALTSIPGFTYVRIFHLCIWRDGWRLGVSWKGTI